MVRRLKVTCNHWGCKELTKSRYCRKHFNEHRALREKIYDRDKWQPPISKKL